MDVTSLNTKCQPDCRGKNYLKSPPGSPVILSDFHIHPKVKKLLEQREEMGNGKRDVDYGMAEALAFGSLVKKGIPIRMSGQDCRRGTFNQRHSVLIDIENEQEYDTETGPCSQNQLGRLTVMDVGLHRGCDRPADRARPDPRPAPTPKSGRRLLVSLTRAGQQMAEKAAPNAVRDHEGNAGATPRQRSAAAVALLGKLR